MPFCTKCGRKIEAGEVCQCSHKAPVYENPAIGEMREKAGVYAKKTAGEIGGAVVGSVNSWKKELKNTGAYERGLSIVPDTVAPNEGEVPIRQYNNIAKLRSRLKLSWADGKMQITNKRLIFRAPGRCLLSGKTVLQHEFAVSDIAGIEVKKDHRFNYLDLIFALIVMGFGMGVMGGIFMAMYMGSEVLAIILGMVFGAGLVLPLFMLDEFKKYLKLLSFSGSLGCFIPLLTSLMSSGAAGAIFGFIIYLVFVIVLFVLILRIAFQGNLNITIKAKSGLQAFEIRCSKRVLFGAIREYTGFDEVLPYRDTDAAIREIGAIIQDIQKNGDEAIARWKN